MKKTVLIFTVIALVSLGIWLGIRWYGRTQIEQAFDGSDIYILENRVLVDSLTHPLMNVKFYWFSYDLGTFGHTDDYISSNMPLSKVNKDNAFFYSGYISSISILNQDTLLIKLTTKEFTLDTAKLKIPIKIELESEGAQIRPSARKNIKIR